jgi:protein O-mannosyl-transferase
MNDKQASKQEPKRIKNYYRISIIFGLLIITGLIIYSNTFHSPFIFDDHSSIVSNEDIKNNLIYIQLNKPRYIGLITFALNYHFNSLNTFGYHVVNMFIHIINATLVFFLTRKIVTLHNDQKREGLRIEIPLIVSLVFLVHPLQTQAVTYIVQRMTSLAALFSITAILLYLEFKTAKSRRIMYYIFSLLASLLAYKTKENTATLPLMIAAIELLFFRQQKITKERILYVLPYILLVLVIPLSFINMHQSYGNLISDLKIASYETTETSRSQYFFTELPVVLTYVRLLIAPVDQSIDYYYPISKSIFEPRTLLAGIILFLILAAGILVLNRYPAITFGILWFFIFLLVESSIIPIRDVIYEHRAYLPSIGFIIAVIYGIFLLEDILKIKRMALLISVVLIIILSIMTYLRNESWRSDISIWEDATSKFPQNARAFDNLGVAFMDQGRYADAFEALKKALENDPYISDPWYHIAICHNKMGSVDDAIRANQIALGLTPQYQRASINLASLFMKKGQYESAYVVLRKAQNFDRGHPVVNAMIAQVYCETGNVAKAITIFNEFSKVEINQSELYFNFGVCLLRHGYAEESRANFFKVIMLNPAETESFWFIGVSYDTEHNYRQAAKYYKEFLGRAHESSLSNEARRRLSEIENMGAGIE